MMDGWEDNRAFFWRKRPIFRGSLAVSSRELSELNF